MRKKRDRILLRTALVLGIFLVVLLIGYFLTQSSWFLNFVRQTVISQADKQLNGSLEIASLEGNIFKNLTLKNIVLQGEDQDQKQTDNNIINLNQIDISYSFSSILQKRIIVKSILVKELTVNLHQNEQGIWNIARIAKNSNSAKADTSSTSWHIDLTSLIVSNSRVNFSEENLPVQFPREIYISQLTSQASLGEELVWEISKADLKIHPQEISLSLRELKGNDKLDVSLVELEMLSPRTQIQLSGNMTNQPDRQADIKFSANPLDFSELQSWLPSFPLQGNPLISGELKLQGDSLSSQIQVKRDKQFISINAQIPNLQNPLTSYLALNWQNLNSRSWKKDLPDSRLNGNLIASISGETWPEVEAQVKLELENSEFNASKINSFLLEAQGSPLKLNGTLITKSEFGNLNIATELNDLLGEMAYEILGSLNSLSIRKIKPDFPYVAQINSHFSLNGKGFTPQELSAGFKLDLTGSYLDSKPLKNLIISGNYQQGNYLLKQMQLLYDGLDFSSQGKGNIYGNHELSYNLQLDSLPRIIQELQPGLALTGSIGGTASGSINDLTAIVKMNLQNVKFQDYQLASLKGESEIRLIEQKPEAEFTAYLSKIALPTIGLDSIWVKSRYTPQNIFVDLNIIQSDSLALLLTGDILPPPLNQARLSKLELKAFGQKWQNLPDTLKINFNPDNLSLHNLQLNSGTQDIAADFSLKSKESYEFRVKCDSLALWPLRYLNPKLETIKGKISLNINGRGVLNNPQLSATWSLDNLSLKEINLHKITGNLNYQGQLAQLNLEVNRARHESISLKGYLPFQVDISKNEFNLLQDEPLKLDLDITPFDLAKLNEYTDDVKEIKGRLNLSVKVENTFNNPLLNAALLVEDAAFKIPDFGIDYRNINLDLQAHNNKFILKKFSIPSDKKGYMNIKGSTILNLKDSRLDSLQITLKASKWQALKSKDMDLKLNSKLKISGNSSYPTFSGYLTILRSRLYLPALLGRNSKKAPLTTPLLLANSPTLNLPEISNPKVPKEPSQIIRNLRGNLLLSFPRNTWIKSKEMNLELGGKLEIIKNSPDFIISGNVMVVRGNYTVYGRRFNISSGNIYFQGESDLDPEIDLVANYILRTSTQEKLTLSSHITGSLQQPVLQFLLDEKQISEGDGISYIVFGKSTAELSSGERSQIDNSGSDNLATKIVVRQIASKVTRALQNRLNLDVIEFKGDNNWRQAQVIVGKYLTNNLFLSYERELSFGRNNGVVPEKITLEYEIRPRIYLQATQGGEKSTGVDLIWKFEK